MNRRPTPIRSQGREAGLALILTLTAIALLVPLILEFFQAMRVEVRAAGNFRDGWKAYYLARSGISFAVALLEEDARNQGEYDALTEPWALSLPPIPLGDGWVQVSITDETGKLNINPLPTGFRGVSSRVYQGVWRRFLEQQELDPGLVDALADWVDRDQNERIPDGAETFFYQGMDPPYPAKDASLDSLEELRLVRGVTSEVYQKLAPYVTLYSDGPININTAPLEVLMALSEDLGEVVAQEIVEYRATTPFEQKIQLRDVIGEDLYNQVAPLVTVRSRHFSIRATARVGGVTRTIQAVVRRGAQKSEILYWREG